MKLSTRSTYGMRALLELALTAGSGPVSASRIAQRQDLSIAYLEQLLYRLRKHGVVSSIRGPRGGYILARDPGQITMAEVVRALDGVPEEISPQKGRNVQRRGWGNGNHSLRRSRAQAAHRHAQLMTYAVWRCVHERLVQSLEAVTLQDLFDQVQLESGDSLDHRYVFHI